MAKRQGSTPKGQSSNSKKTNMGKKGESTVKSTEYEAKGRKAQPARTQAAKATGASGDGAAAKGATKKPGALKRVAAAVTRTVSKLRPGKRREPQLEEQPAAQTPRKAKASAGQKAARATRRETDIPMDVLDNTYTPQQTSLKAGFRADGQDRQNDQEFARGVADDRFNDEDVMTNKSGDPRIGTHGRTYEPGETRTSSHSK